MKVIDVISRFTRNLRGCFLHLSSAQVLISVAKGKVFHKDIVEDTNLHCNTVTNILRDLVEQGLVSCTEFKRPRKYSLTKDGEIVVKRLLTMKDNDED